MEMVLVPELGAVLTAPCCPEEQRNHCPGEGMSQCGRANAGKQREASSAVGHLSRARYLHRVSFVQVE